MLNVAGANQNATGASPSDFAPEDYEVDWVGRGTLDDLNSVGRKQLGLEAW